MENRRIFVHFCDSKNKEVLEVMHKLLFLSLIKN